MIEALLGEVSRRLADRWLTRALVPGLLWCAVLAFAILPGRHGVFDVPGAARAAARSLDHLRDRVSLGIVSALLIVATATAAAAAAQAVGVLVRFLWLGRWPGPGRRLAAMLTARRRAAAQHRLGAAGRALPSAYLPARPTWIADRIRLADDRVAAQYGLRLALVWPRLWLLLDVDGRAQVARARDRFEQAGMLGGWAVLYLVAAPWWWPAVPVGLGIGAVAWWRARSAAPLLADIVEATVDLHHRRLVAELGFPVEVGRPLDAATADAINDQLHKGGSGYRQVAATGAVSEPTAYPPSSSTSDSRARKQPEEPTTKGLNTTVT